MTSSCQKTFKKKRGSLILGFLFLNFFGTWKPKKRSYQSYKGYFWKNLPKFTIFWRKKGTSLSNLDHSFYNLSPEYSEVSKKNLLSFMAYSQIWLSTLFFWMITNPPTSQNWKKKKTLFSNSKISTKEE